MCKKKKYLLSEPPLVISTNDSPRSHRSPFSLGYKLWRRLCLISASLQSRARTPQRRPEIMLIQPCLDSSCLIESKCLLGYRISGQSRPETPRKRSNSSEIVCETERLATELMEFQVWNGLKRETLMLTHQELTCPK